MLANSQSRNCSAPQIFEGLIELEKNNFNYKFQVKNVLIKK